MKYEDIVKYVQETNENYIKSIKFDHVKEHSQYFTSFDIASKMMSTIDVSLIEPCNVLRILEPAAGTGVLIIEFCNHILKKTRVNTIEIDIFETDKNLIKLLKKNMLLLRRYIKEKYNVTMKIRYYNENFLTTKGYIWNRSQRGKYDIILTNPPFKKINISSEEASNFENIIVGQPNLYHLFIALALKMLKENGILVVLSPRNYLSGRYTEKLRSWIFNNYMLTNLHIFDSRTKIFREVLQEIIISTFVKNNKDNYNIKICHNEEKIYLKIPFKEVVLGKNKNIIMIPTHKEDLKIISVFLKFKNTLRNVGIKLAVGPIVPFRNKKYLSYENYSTERVPFFIVNDIKLDKIDYENRAKKYKSYSNTKVSLLNDNANYLITRKLTAKDDKYRLISTVYKEGFFESKYIALDNNLIYFKDTIENNIYLLYGLFVVLTSTHFRDYFNLISGTHTINTYELEEVTIPSREKLIKVGLEYSKYRTKADTKDDIMKLCDNIFGSYLI